MALTESLHALFLMDQKVRGLESRLDGARKHVRVQQIKIEQLNQQHADVLGQLKQAKTHAASLEHEVGSHEQKIDKLREQMNTAKTNKEYSALLVEVNTFKADKSKLEDQALEQLGRVDAFQAELDTLDKQLEEQRRIKQVADKELEARTAEVADQLAQFKAERAQAAQAVDPTALRIFERLAEAFDGEAMAPVIEADHRRMEYICGGCYMQIPVETVNQLATQDKIIRCTSCTRILYLESELKSSMANH